MAVDRLGRPLRDDPYRGNVRVYSSSNITLSGLQTIDGVTLESGDRVLCNGQTTTSQNGIYVASNGVWSRSRDLSSSDDFTGPIIVTVEEGTTYRNTFWHMLPASTITVGTDAISFTSGYPASQFGNGSALSVFGRASDSSGVRADIAGTDGQVLRVSGTTLGFGTIAAAGLASDSVTTAKIADGNVTLAKMANLAEARIIGRADGAGTGVPTALTPLQVRTAINLDGAEILRPENYGAKGDWDADAATGTDDTTALQNMFDAFSNVGVSQRKRPGVVMLRPGAVYRVTSPIKVQQYNIIIWGQEAGIYNSAGGTALFIDHADSINNVHGVAVYDLWVGSDASGSGHGIHARSAPQLVIEGCTVSSFASDSSTGSGSNSVGGKGILLEGCVAATVRGNNVYKTGGIGIHSCSYSKTWSAGAGGPVIAESQGNVIEGNRVYYTGSIGILVSEGGGNKVVRNDIESCGGGVEIRSCYDFSVEDNYFEVNTADIVVRNLVDLVGARSITGGRIIGNQCESTTGISLESGEDVAVLYNRISGNVSIALAFSRAYWGRQVELSGTLTDLSTTTIYALDGLTSVPAARGGTGQTSYAVGDLLYASASTTLSKLAAVATGNVLISGGVTTAPSWGKVGLTTHVSGTLPVANGGTGRTSTTDYKGDLGLPTSSTANRIPKFSDTSGTIGASVGLNEDASGNVGVRLSPSGSFHLEVDGPVKIGGEITLGAGSAARSSGDFYWDAGYPSGTGAHHFRQGAGLTEYMTIDAGVQFGSAIRLKSYTVATLPSGSAGDTAYATDARKNNEGAGAGTGSLVWRDGSAWRSQANAAASVITAIA